MAAKGALIDGICWGWASIVTKKGQPVVDFQGDSISPDELMQAAHSFLTDSRIGGAMHIRGPDGQPLKAGEVVESVVFTKALQDALGLNLGFEGWLVGIKISDPTVRRMVADGTLRSLSIGGSGYREPIAPVTKRRIFAKGAAGNPGLVHTPGRLQLQRGGKKRRRGGAGRTELFQKGAA